MFYHSEAHRNALNIVNVKGQYRELEISENLLISNPEADIIMKFIRSVTVIQSNMSV